MGTYRKVNAVNQVKEVNGKRWICKRVTMTDSTKNMDYDFMDNADGKLWKMIRPWKPTDLLCDCIAGQGKDDVY